jgi:hypothetical protein
LAGGLAGGWLPWLAGLAGDWLAGLSVWLAGWLADWLAVWLAGWLVWLAWLAGWLAWLAWLAQLLEIADHTVVRCLDRRSAPSLCSTAASA